MATPAASERPAAALAGTAPERWRLFVALELPEDVRELLAGWGRRAAGERSGLVAVAEASLHVTLCFLGMRLATEVSAIARAAAVLEGARVAPLALGAALWLPRRRPRVLAVALEDPSAALATAQVQLARALVAAGAYEPETRAYLPHVSVCRVRGQVGVRAEAIEPPSSGEFAGARVALLRSHLGQGPARYETIATIPLIAA